MLSQQELQEKYKKKDEKSHVLDNPDTYIGSVEQIDSQLWIHDGARGGFTNKNISFVPGLYKLFDESIVNTRDHFIRCMTNHAIHPENTKLVSNIDVSVCPTTGMITMKNDGNGIDVEKHEEYGIWIPELIFGHLRSSSNFNKNEKKIVGGKNGFGVKLIFIWSTYGKIETVDHIRNLKYTQEFRDNLSSISPPTITKVSGKSSNPYTLISFIPDYKRFYGEHFVPGEPLVNQDMLNLFKKRTFDIAAITRVKKISFNDEIIPIKSFNDYIELHFKGVVDEDGFEIETKHQRRVHEIPNERWEYTVALSPTKEFQQISFVNGISTFKGGKHVDYILQQILRKLTDFIEKKKKIKVSPSSIKEQLFLFLRCDIENPSFDSQTKENLTTPYSKFGSSCTVSDSFIEKLAKMDIMEIACSVSQAREIRQSSKKTDGVKLKTIHGIPNFIDANYSGTSKSKDCILILCEGLSAMSGIISGLSSADRNTIGIYPLKGKLLNVRGEHKLKINENKEIKDIKKILALESGKQYKTIRDVHENLRYGKIMFLTDSDTDGSHIKGLCINLFHSEWSSLFRIDEFLSFMNTPIIKAWKGQTVKKDVMLFYNQGEYNSWKNTISDSHKWNIKYFKGLGTSTSVEFKEYFANKKIVNFTYNNENSDESLDKVFNKKRADDRKVWITNYDKNAYLNTSRTSVFYEEFVDNELKHFSVYDCARSIPNLIDGLKISMRKILFCAFKKNLTSEIKVAQFSGYISEKSCYHHGEVSLSGAIINMAQTFVGSNNINLLEPNGQFGTRLHGGNDSAAERYIFTKLNPISRKIFLEKDDDILNYLEDDGTLIEPEFFVPVIPFVLMNGISGIGTGFSSNIPPYNPRDIIKYLKLKLKNKDDEARNWIREVVPYYKGFKGKVVRITSLGEYPEKFLIGGVYEKRGDDTIVIKELPVGTWTMPYINYLESIMENETPATRIIKNIVNLSTESEINISVVFHKDKLSEYLLPNVSDDTGIMKLAKLLKLTASVSTSNMYLFDKNCVLRKYNNIKEIIDHFYECRMVFYEKQKTHLLKFLRSSLEKIQNRVKYINFILDGTIDLKKIEDDENLYLILQNLGHLKIDDSFDYLIKMPMNSLTKKNVEKLNSEHAKLVQEIQIVQDKTISQMWWDDLENIVV